MSRDTGQYCLFAERSGRCLQDLSSKWCPCEPPAYRALPSLVHHYRHPLITRKTPNYHLLLKTVRPLNELYWGVYLNIEAVLRLHRLKRRCRDAAPLDVMAGALALVHCCKTSSPGSPGHRTKWTLSGDDSTKGQALGTHNSCAATFTWPLPAFDCWLRNASPCYSHRCRLLRCVLGAPLLHAVRPGLSTHAFAATPVRSAPLQVPMVQ